MRKNAWKSKYDRTQDEDEVVEEFHVQCQHTAGAYKTVAVCSTRSAAEKHMSLIAGKYHIPYHGENKFQTSNDKHNCTRYRIMPFKVEPLLEECDEEEDSGPEMPWDCSRHFN